MSTVVVECKECNANFEFYVEEEDRSVGLFGVGFTPEFDPDIPCDCGEMPPTEDDAEKKLNEEIADAQERRAEDMADDDDGGRW